MAELELLDLGHAVAKGALGIHGAPCFLYYGGDKLGASKCLRSSLADFLEVTKTQLKKQPFRELHHARTTILNFHLN